MSSNKISDDEIIKELYKAEEEINENINKSQSIQKGFKEYGLINSKWLENYIFYLKNKNDNIFEGNLFSRKYIFGKNEEKDYTYINKGMIFNFQLNFSFVTKKSMFLISEFNNSIKFFSIFISKNLIIIIGGECIIKRDFRGVAPYSYIILYKENKNNNIDYILQIEDKKEREEARDYILKNTIWNYLKK